MSKIILKEISRGTCCWFCNNCNQRIDGVSETFSSRPLIDKCPHCNSIFSDYELCESRINMQNRVFAELDIVDKETDNDKNSN